MNLASIDFEKLMNDITNLSIGLDREDIELSLVVKFIASKLGIKTPYIESYTIESSSDPLQVLELLGDNFDNLAQVVCMLCRIGSIKLVKKRKNKYHSFVMVVIPWS